MKRLLSTISGQAFPFERIEEFADNGESLEVSIDGLAGARVRPGRHLWERFADFMPVAIDGDLSLGEGNTPLLPAGEALCRHTGIRRLLLKNETVNPTWSFKDRGSLTTIAMARLMGETVTATISTGNMGNSIAAYAAHAGIRAVVFVPRYAPPEKIRAIAIHGASVVRVSGADYSVMKRTILGMAPGLNLRVVSGNGPIRTEGYKLEAFEMVEQLEGGVPDFIAVPTSACGHIRGIFKGYRELLEAGIINRLPRMIVVQAANVNPLVSAIREGRDRVVPVTGKRTVAEAITSGDPPGGDEIVQKARQYGWLAEDVPEEEILDAQRRLAGAGYFVEPAAAAPLAAARKLRASGQIGEEHSVVLMLTGSGLKDMSAVARQHLEVIESDLSNLRCDVERILAPSHKDRERIY
ncbi:MAG: threonine synthase [Syntrophaceae bacterium]|nr:threonine synthase [Syntrophaceae bacterium]